jgi:hypothetical protein
MDVTVTIPDDLLNKYAERRETYNPYALARGLPPMPAPTRAELERFIRRRMAQLLLQESARLDPGDGSVYDADAALERP